MNESETLKEGRAISIIKDILRILSKYIAVELHKSIHSEINKYIEDVVEKSIKGLFNVGIVVSLIGIGFLLFFWGIASYIDRFFNNIGFGFIIIGIMVVLMGIKWWL